ncbi:response regulator, partial [Halorussus sp. GCM10023401]
MDESDAPTVLVIEDEPDLGRLYELWLEDDYDVKHVETGEQALSALDDSVDVVLLDRRLPGMSGRAVLEEIRERDVDCRVAMVTAVDPSFDVVEMGFDTYVTKPPDREQLRD